MSGLSASKSPPAPRPQARDGVAGMGYRLAAGGLAGRLRAGDGGTGPCLEDAWVKRTARFWMEISRIAARAVPMDAAARSLAAARDGALTRVRNLPSFKLPSVSLPSTNLPLLDICQGAAALTVIAIGSSTFVCWQESHAQRQLPVRAQAGAMSVPAVPAKAGNQPIQVASLSPPPAAPIIATPPAEIKPALPAPPPVVAQAAPAIIAPPPIAPSPAVMLADEAAPSAPARPRAPHAAHPQEPAPRVASAPRVALAPRIFTILATRPMPRPHRPPHVVAAQYEMPHWLTEPRAPLVMSEPPHALSLPPQYAQQPQSFPRPYQAPSRTTPPLLERPRVDRFAEGSYVPPMMPGMYQ